MTGRAVASMPLARPGDDVRRVTRRGGLGDLLDGAPAAAGVVLGDRDEQERDREADERRSVQLPERELPPSNASVTGMNPTADSTVATITLV